MKSFFKHHQAVLCCLVFISFNTYSQGKQVTVENVSGEYIYNINSDISFKKAKEYAISDAKTNALKKAGISEIISNTEILSKTSNISGDLQQLYNSITTAEIRGEILEYNITNNPKPIEISNNTYRTKVIINATVIKYENKIDKLFDFEIKGIKNTYLENEGFTFTITPFKDGYLNIFIVGKDKNDVTYLYPNKYENNKLLLKDKTILFPINNAIEYALTIKKNIEKNDLFFILTKEKNKFNKEENLKNMTKWIYSISPNNRKIKYFTIIVSKKLKTNR